MVATDMSLIDKLTAERDVLDGLLDEAMERLNDGVWVPDEMGEGKDRVRWLCGAWRGSGGH